jgi:hypothetical protein
LLCLLARFSALHSRKDIKFLSLAEDHPIFPKNVCKNLLINEQKKENKGTNNDLQNTTPKTKDWVTWTNDTKNLKTWKMNPTKHDINRGELMCSPGVCSSCSTCGIHRINLVTNPVISHKKGPDCHYDKRNIHVVICDPDIL